MIGLLATVDYHPQPEEDETALKKFESEFVAAGKISQETADTLRALYDLNMDVEWKRLGPVSTEEAKAAIQMSERVYNAISGQVLLWGC